MMGAIDRACAVAFSVRAARALAVSSAVPARPRKPPSCVPRALLAARAAFVRAEIMPGLQLGHRHHALQEEATRGSLDLGKVAEAYIDASLEDPRQEALRASQAVDLGNHQRCTVRPTRRQCFGQFRPIGALAALDLYELVDELPLAAVQVGLDGSSLGLEALNRISPADPLRPVGKNESPLRHDGRPSYCMQRSLHIVILQLGIVKLPPPTTSAEVCST